MTEYMGAHKQEAGKRERQMELAGWLAGFFICSILVPMIVLLLLPSSHRPAGAAELLVVPLMEYRSVSVGIGMGLDLAPAFILTVFPCVGLCMLMTGLLGFFMSSTPRSRKILASVRSRIDNSSVLRKYGIFSNFFFIIFLGVYIAPGVSVLLGWSRVRSVMLMTAGILFITLLISLATLGIIDLVGL